MSDIAIRVENLSKLYRIGERQASYKTFREALAELASAPFRRLRRDGPSPDSTIWALKDVSFEVKRGEVLGIIGRNGSGKTTLLKILSRITEPTEGHAEIYGRVASLLEVGTGFHPELTGRENIYLNGAILGMRRKEIERKFDEIVDFAELERFLDTPVKRYSSGMYMRLAFAVAAHLEPEILLVDEVLAVGDAAFQRKCLGKMGEVAGEGRTVLFVSHNMAAVKSLCGTSILLEEGKVANRGDANSVAQIYLNSMRWNLRNDGEIAENMYAYGIDRVKVLRAEILDADGESTYHLWLKQPFRVAVDFELKVPVKEARFGIGINTIDGVRIATVHHTDDGLAPLHLQPGKYHIEAKFSNILSPGIYEISLGAHEPLAGLGLFYIPRALQVTVADISEGEKDFEQYNPGLVSILAEWEGPCHV